MIFVNNHQAGVLAPGNEARDTINSLPVRTTVSSSHYSSDDPIPFTPPQQGRGQSEAVDRAEFEKLLELEANDEVGHLVDLYFRRPASVLRCS